MEASKSDCLAKSIYGGRYFIYGGGQEMHASENGLFSKAVVCKSIFGGGHIISLASENSGLTGSLSWFDIVT